MMTNEFTTEPTIYFEGMFYKCAKLDARIGELVLLKLPYKGRYIHEITEYLDDENDDMSACIASGGELWPISIMDYSLLIPIGSGKRVMV